MPVGFFQSSQAPQNRRPELINLQNKPFHALAIILLNEITTKPISDASLKSILDIFYQNYPELKPNAPYLTKKEDSKASLNSLLNVVFAEQPSKLIDCFARMLQRCCAIGLLKDPYKYFAIFSRFTAQTPQALLQESDIVLPKEALAGITDILNFIEISLIITKSSRDLQAQELYTNPEFMGPKLRLPFRHHDGNYLVENNQLKGAQLTQLNAVAKAPGIATNEGTLSDVFKIISSIRQSYAHTHHMLSNKITLKEISFGDLKALYIHLADKLQDFPEHLLKTSIPNQAGTTYENALQQKLIHCFAANIATKHLSQEAFDLCCDNLSNESPSAQRKVHLPLSPAEPLMPQGPSMGG